MKQHLTLAFKKSPDRDNADPALGSINQKKTGLLKPDIVPKQENMHAGTRDFSDSVNLPKDEKTVLLEKHLPEKKSYPTTDLSLASAGTNRYEEIVANGVNIYNTIRAESNGTGSSNTGHLHQRVMQSSGKMTSQEMSSFQNAEVQHRLPALQPVLAIGSAVGLGSNKNSIGLESQYYFDHQPSPVTTNKPPNFVKKLETFVDSVHRLENDRYMTCWGTTLPKEVAQVESVINRHLIAGQKELCTPVTNAHGDNDGNNLPLDLSKKANRLLGRRSERFEPLLEANGTAETSSLARLEEKFGANSSILDRIGAQPCAALCPESGNPSGNGPLGNCLSRRSTNSRIPGVPVTHSKGAVPVPSAKVQSHHSSNLKTGTLSRQKTNAAPEALRTTPRSSGEMSHPSDQDTSQYARCETVLRTACMPGTLLRCPCGSVFDLLSLFMDHVRKSGHSLFGAEVNEAKSLQSTGLGHRLWATKHGYDGLPYIPQCIECGRYFQSLPELTIHMIQMAHYLNLVHSSVAHQRPSSVCSASTLDSFEGVENSSSETGGYTKTHANILKTPVCSQFPVQEQTIDFSWNGISADRLSAGVRPVMLEQHEFLSPCGNSKHPERHLRTKLKSTPVSQISSAHSKCSIAAVKLEADGRVAARSSSNSSQLGFESRSNYSSPNFRNDLEIPEGSAESNLTRLAQDVMSHKAPAVLKGFENGWKEDQTSTVSALVAMQDFVQRSFSSCKDLDINAKSSFGNKQQSIPTQHSTSKMQWNFQKSSCQNLSPTQTLARRQKRRNQTSNSRPPGTSETSPGAVHPKRKGTVRSRNLNYWKNLTVERREDCRDRTSELLRQQRIKSWRCSSSELVNGLTATTVRPSSVDGVLVARKHASALDSIHVRKRHHSADFQRPYSTEDSLDDLTRFKNLLKCCSDSM